MADFKYSDFTNYIQYGDFHVHTNYTDGKNTVMEYSKKAEESNLKLIAFTEHVRKRLAYNYDNFLFYIAKARAEFNHLEILHGCEAKVLNVDGELDALEKILNLCDVVIGVLHSFEHKDKKNYLAALKAMLRNPAVNIWGHPTLFAKRYNMELGEDELNEIINICVNNNVLIERNLRYNLPDVSFMSLAINRGAKFVVGSDAHNTSELLTVQKLEKEWKCINKMC